MSKISFVSVLILFIAYSSVNGQSAHYFDKYIEGVFKTIENPPAECVNFLDELVQSKRLEDSILSPCFSWIEKEIPKQIKFDILSHRPKEKLRAEAIKNQAIFGTCYLKDPDSKYYDTSYAELDVKSNKLNEEKLYIDNINSHCNTLHMMQLETDYIFKEIRKKKALRTMTTLSTGGSIIGSLAILTLVAIPAAVIWALSDGIG